jgi:hypothetical protein
VHGDDALHLSSLAASIAMDSVALSEISRQFVLSVGHPHYTISPETPITQPPPPLGQAEVNDGIEYE